MWQYLWGHVIYHLFQWFPRTNRVKMQVNKPVSACTVVALLLTLCLLVPQFWVLLQEHSTRWCSQPLFALLITSIIFTFFIIGFTFLFLTMVSVPRELKFAFHFFGLINFIAGLVQVILTSKAGECDTSTEELYKMSLALAVLSGIAIVYLILLLPFWLANSIKQGCILDYDARQGICYEPVRCCSCLWHI